MSIAYVCFAAGEEGAKEECTTRLGEVFGLYDGGGSSGDCAVISSGGPRAPPSFFRLLALNSFSKSSPSLTTTFKLSSQTCCLLWPLPIGSGTISPFRHHANVSELKLEIDSEWAEEDEKDAEEDRREATNFAPNPILLQLGCHGIGMQRKTQFVWRLLYIHHRRIDKMLSSISSPKSCNACTISATCVEIKSRIFGWPPTDILLTLILYAFHFSKIHVILRRTSTLLDVSTGGLKDAVYMIMVIVTSVNYNGILSCKTLIMTKADWQWVVRYTASRAVKLEQLHQSQSDESKICNFADVSLG